MQKAAIYALEEALAKQEQGEPVALNHIPDAKKMVEQEQVEPVAWLEGETIYWKEDQGLNDWIRKDGEPLYTTPQQRTWVGLTDGQKQTAAWSNGGFGEGALWAETQLKENNA
jgi:hypothetical protein